MTTQKYKKNKLFRKTHSKKQKGGRDEEDCPICFDKLKKTDKIPKLRCKHKFHKGCLEHVCRQKGNKNVPCPLCRGDISFACNADITRNTPWIYNPYTNPTPFSQHQMMRMTAVERRQHDNEIQRHRRNYLARRRRSIARETPAERAAREQREQEFETQARQERQRLFENNNNMSDIMFRRNINRDNQIMSDIRSRGIPSPRNFIYIPDSPEGPPPGYEDDSPIFSPHSPDYPPPGYEDDSPMFIPQSPVNTPPLLTMEDLRTTPTPPLTMDDLRGGKKTKKSKRKTKKSKKSKRKTRRK